jgi:hypothetical protein
LTLGHPKIKVGELRTKAPPTAKPNRADHKRFKTRQGGLNIKDLCRRAKPRKKSGGKITSQF